MVSSYDWFMQIFINFQIALLLTHGIDPDQDVSCSALISDDQVLKIIILLTRKDMESWRTNQSHICMLIIWPINIDLVQVMQTSIQGKMSDLNNKYTVLTITGFSRDSSPPVEFVLLSERRPISRSCRIKLENSFNVSLEMSFWLTSGHQKFTSFYLIPI